MTPPSPRTPRSRAGGFLALAATLALAAACGGRDAPADPSRRAWTPIALARTEAGPARAPVERARHATPSGGAQPWTVKRGGPGRVVEAAASDRGPRSAFVLDAPGPRVVTFPLELEARTIDRAEVDLVLAEGEEDLVRLAFYNGDRARAYSVLTLVHGAAGVVTATFDLAAMRDLEGRLDRGVLQIGGKSTSTGIVEVRLASRPALSLLPDPEHGPRLVALGHDGREGVGLGPGDVLAAPLLAGRAPTLSFSYQTAPAQEVGTASLVVEVGGAAHAFPLAAPGKRAWADVRLAVGGADGVRFRLEGGEEGSDPHTLVADVGLRDPAAFEGAVRTVLLVTSDTHRGDMLGILGGPEPVHTPRLNALAARGVLFEDAVASSNATNPSHASLLTGVHVRDTRVVTNNSPLADDVQTLAERFRAAGWRTSAAVSVVHMGHRMSGFGQGFDRYDAPPFPTGADVSAHDGSEDSVRLGEETVAAALRQVEAAGDLPLFLWVHVYDAHVPYLPPPGFDRKYFDGDPTQGPGLPIPYEKLHGSFAGLRDPAFPKAQYRALVDYVDHALAPVLELPRVRAGAVAFSADHGESFGNHGNWWDHVGIYRDNTHVPLVLTWPGAPTARVAEPVRQMDVGRTLLNLAGLDGAAFPGRDLRGALGSDWPREARYAIAGAGTSASLDDGRWVLVLHFVDEASNDATRTYRKGQVELFDRSRDPECVLDVADQEVERARRMRRAMLAWLADAAPAGMTGEFFVTEEAAAALAKLGYAAGTTPTGPWYAPGPEDDFVRRFGD